MKKYSWLELWELGKQKEKELREYVNKKLKEFKKKGGDL